MHVNDHKIQYMAVINVYLYHFMLINIIRRVPFQFFSSKNQHD